MGDIADMMLDGTMCQECGCYIEDDELGNPAGGHPRWCFDCGGDPQTNGATKRKKKKKTTHPA